MSNIERLEVIGATTDVIDTHGAPTAREPQVVVLRVASALMKNFNYFAIDPASRQAVVIDPAWEMEKIDEVLVRERIDLAGVLITHSHMDHINLAARVSEKYACPTWMSRQEVEVSAYRAPRLVAIDEAPWCIGAMRIVPIPTPGHTAGCICYLIGDNIFTGDVLFAEGCGMCPDLPGAYAMYESLELLKRRLDPSTRVYPGHSYGKEPGQLFSQLLRDNIYLHFRDKSAFAAFRLRKGQSRAKMFDFS